MAEREGVSPLILLPMAIACFLGVVIGSCGTNSALCEPRCIEEGYAGSEPRFSVRCHCVTRGEEQP